MLVAGLAPGITGAEAQNGEAWESAFAAAPWSFTQLARPREQLLGCHQSSSSVLPSFQASSELYWNEIQQTHIAKST